MSLLGRQVLTLNSFHRKHFNLLLAECSETARMCSPGRCVATATSCDARPDCTQDADHPACPGPGPGQGLNGLNLGASESHSRSHYPPHAISIQGTMAL